MSRSGASGYAIALPLKVSSGTYLIKCDDDQRIGIGYFSQNGTYQSYVYKNSLNDTPFIVSSSIDNIIVTTPGGYPSASVYTNLHLYKLD